MSQGVLSDENFNAALQLAVKQVFLCIKNTFLFMFSQSSILKSLKIKIL